MLEPPCASNMDLKHIENEMKDSGGGIVEKKDIIESNIEQSNSNKTDSSSALQQFLNHIPINSILCITTSPVLELNSDDYLKDAISLLYEKNVFGAPITDVANFDAGLAERYIGFIDFNSMVQWSIKNAVIQLLLQSSRLELFDRIAYKPLSEFGLENNCRVVYGDESLSDDVHSMWKNQTDAVPVVDRKTKTLIGNVRNNDIHLLLDSYQLFMD